MLLIVVYIIGCFLGGLYLADRRYRAVTWIVVASAALVGAAYPATPPSFLSGFSISSLSAGETHGTPPDPLTALSVSRDPVAARLGNRFGRARIAAAVARFERSEPGALAAAAGFALYVLGAGIILLR